MTNTDLKQAIVAIQYLPWLRFPQTLYYYLRGFRDAINVAIQYLPWLRFPQFEQCRFYKRKTIKVAIQYLPWLRFPQEIRDENSKHSNTDGCRNPVFTLAKIPTRRCGRLRHHLLKCRNPVFTLAKIPTSKDITACGLQNGFRVSQSSIYPG